MGPAGSDTLKPGAQNLQNPAEVGSRWAQDGARTAEKSSKKANAIKMRVAFYSGAPFFPKKCPRWPRLGSQNGAKIDTKIHHFFDAFRDRIFGGFWSILGAKVEPSWHQNRIKNRPVPPDRPKTAQEHPKSAPRAPQECPRGIQKAPKSTQKAPKSTQKVPKSTQKTPKRHPKAPKRHQREPKRHPRERREHRKQRERGESEERQTTAKITTAKQEKQSGIRERERNERTRTKRENDSETREPWACFVELIRCNRLWACFLELILRFPFSAAQVSRPAPPQKSFKTFIKPTKNQ